MWPHLGDFYLIWIIYWLVLLTFIYNYETYSFALGVVFINASGFPRVAGGQQFVTKRLELRLRIKSVGPIIINAGKLFHVAQDAGICRTIQVAYRSVDRILLSSGQESSVDFPDYGFLTYSKIDSAII